ncbi:DUF4430 domain-containing protein [Neobacillus cucumis]|uniref:Transcobalamin-like C-terminal domain-containing protein n=1 Tax=Neobacillus cucumis TaxID=1740721 RepID=A0A2N5HNY8_9BACI|nr:DUF4430 domain-containing protein [Neobacillus cucumis]PLS07224.1 hypothetical protein CVD27_05970 [Neobacillus cucumis]
MNRFINKITSLLSIILIIVSLAGCSSNEVSPKETKKETTTEVSAKAEKESKPDTKQQPAEDKTKTSAASTETKQQQPAAEKTETEKSTQPAQQSSSTTSKKTTSVPSTTTKDSGTATTQTTGATTTKTTGTTSTKTTGSTSTKTTSTPTGKTTSTTPGTTTNSTPATKPAATAPKPVAMVSLSIVGPKDRGTILGTSKINIQDGYTIFDVVKQAAKAKGIVVDSTGSGASTYIEGIDNIYEFDYGAKSGWMFKHNGATITKSVGVIKVKAGDRIECYYTE